MVDSAERLTKTRLLFAKALL